MVVQQVQPIINNIWLFIQKPITSKQKMFKYGLPAIVRNDVVTIKGDIAFYKIRLCCCDNRHI